MLSLVMLCCLAECHYVVYHYSECRYDEYHYSECCYIECRYAECRGAILRFFETVNMLKMQMFKKNLQNLTIGGERRWRGRGCDPGADVIKPFSFIGVVSK